MRLSIAAVAACLASAQAFRDTSPFVLLSSTPLPKDLEALSKSQIQPASHVIGAVASHFQACDSDIYYIISQPSLSSSDVTADAFPNLNRHASKADAKIMVSDVQGLTDGTSTILVDTIKNGCRKDKVEIEEISGSEEERPSLDLDGALKRGSKIVVVMKFGNYQLSTVAEEREEQLRDNDARINSLLNSKVHGADYTVIYTSTPLNATISRELMSYQADFMDTVHMDLKRSVKSRVPAKTAQRDSRPLFEAYQFLTPGLFMGILVTLIMVAILSVGISAISSLQVSYGAFDKEMGPAAQKKQQ